MDNLMPTPPEPEETYSETQRPFGCPECDQWFESENLRSNHLIQHTDNVVILTTEMPENAKYVVFDTETTGIFNFRLEDGSPAPADGPGQPRLASAAFIITDEFGIEISREKHFVKPDGWSMPQGLLDNGKPSAGMVNGLTDEFLAENGVAVTTVLDLWESYVAAGLMPAAFNAQFDSKMMRAELRRAGRDDLFEQTRQTCVMRALKAYKDQGLVLKNGQFVKLSAACEFFGIALENAHDAMSDTEAARAILEILIRDGNVIEPKVHYAQGVSK